MLVRSRRAATLAIGAALVAFATACTNPTAPSTTARDGVGIGSSGAGVGVGSSGAAPMVCRSGVGVGSSGC